MREFNLVRNFAQEKYFHSYHPATNTISKLLRGKKPHLETISISIGDITFKMRTYELSND